MWLCEACYIISFLQGQYLYNYLVHYPFLLHVKISNISGHLSCFVAGARIQATDVWNCWGPSTYGWKSPNKRQHWRINQIRKNKQHSLAHVCYNAATWIGLETNFVKQLAYSIFTSNSGSSCEFLGGYQAFMALVKILFNSLIVALCDKFMF